MKSTVFRPVIVLLLSATISARAQQIVVPYANGSDQAFSPTTNTQIDLSLADTISFSDLVAGANPNPGEGVYVPDQWAVVFRYSSVNIPSNVTITFRNHPSRAPVIWLVSGDVTINGVVSLDGQGDTSNVVNEPGPGGFRGGRPWISPSAPGGPGSGPGGARFWEPNPPFPIECFYASGAGFAFAGGQRGGTPGVAYGNEAILPLIGGSGGATRYFGCSAQTDGSGGGAGGGAILIAAANSIRLGNTSPNAQIHTRGGNGGGRASAGSGGAIRLITATLTGQGTLRALGGNTNFGYAGEGSVGRIRVEAVNASGFADPGNPAYSALALTNGHVATIFPDQTAPRIQIVSVGPAATPTDPRADHAFTGTDIRLDTPEPQVVVMEAFNVPLSWIVELRVAPIGGPELPLLPATPTSGDTAHSLWSVTLDVPPGVSTFQVRAHP